MALLHGDAGRPIDALAALDRTVALQPDNARAHNNRGSALQLLGRLWEAEAAFRRALELAPNLELPYINLGKLYEQQGKSRMAAELYRRAIATGLDRSLFDHFLAAATGVNTDRAPPRWVRETFDNFAPLFDERVRDLRYDAPRQLAELIRSYATGPMDILDLGCGTGQCGMHLASTKLKLVGVDLSAKMMALARLNNAYDELHVDDVQDWLVRAGPATFDLVIAADLFIYFGALDETFREISRVTRSKSLFAFSTEESPDLDYALLPSGRYAHADAYIRRLAATSFAILNAEPTVIRMESGAPLAGRLYVLERC
jgi:predicted TPR repeat methyltransferase